MILNQNLVSSRKHLQLFFSATRKKSLFFSFFLAFLYRSKVDKQALYWAWRPLTLQKKYGELYPFPTILFSFRGSGSVTKIICQHKQARHLRKTRLISKPLTRVMADHLKIFQPRETAQLKHSQTKPFLYFFFLLKRTCTKRTCLLLLPTTLEHLRRKRKISWRSLNDLHRKQPFLWPL